MGSDVLMYRFVKEQDISVSNTVLKAYEIPFPTSLLSAKSVGVLQRNTVPKLTIVIFLWNCTQKRYCQIWYCIERNHQKNLNLMEQLLLWANYSINSKFCSMEWVSNFVIVNSLQVNQKHKVLSFFQRNFPAKIQTW
jgi:hypothetical protein